MNDITEPVNPATKTFFHAAYVPLAPGSVIEPGSYGRMLNLYRRGNDNLYTLLRETIFEQVRCQDFPHRPSRLNCVFLCRTEDELRIFMQDNHTTDIPYEVTLEHNDATVFYTCYDLPDIPAGPPLLPTLRERVAAYWRGEDVEKSRRVEGLTTSPVRVVRRLDI